MCTVESASPLQRPASLRGSEPCPLLPVPSGRNILLGYVPDNVVFACHECNHATAQWSRSIAEQLRGLCLKPHMQWSVVKDTAMGKQLEALVSAFYDEESPPMLSRAQATTLMQWAAPPPEDLERVIDTTHAAVEKRVEELRRLLAAAEEDLKVNEETGQHLRDTEEERRIELAELATYSDAAYQAAARDDAEPEKSSGDSEDGSVSGSAASLGRRKRDGSQRLKLCNWQSAEKNRGSETPRRRYYSKLRTLSCPGSSADQARNARG